MSDQSHSPAGYLAASKDTVSLVLRYPCPQHKNLLLDILVKPAGMEPEVAAVEVARCVIPVLQDELRPFFRKRLPSFSIGWYWQPPVHIPSISACRSCTIVLAPLAGTCICETDHIMFRRYCAFALERMLQHPLWRNWHLFGRYVF